MLLARIFKAFPPTCPHGSGEMRIIAYVTGPASILANLAHIGESTRPPSVAPARDPPAWAGHADAGEVTDPQGEPEHIFDQRISW